jgi:amino acid adenylation domain-containing protein
MQKDIAIIGMAGRFPEAGNISKFYENLCGGRDSVRTLSATRIHHTSLYPQRDYKSFAFLEDIDVFDYKFFQIPLGEARYMDPHQRLLLEVVHEAMENAGYDTAVFSNSRTAVFVGDTNLQYRHLAREYDPMLITGNSNAATAGRIARIFNLNGNALMVDTACSSSLVALHLACNELLLGEAEYALACGVKLILFPDEKDTAARDVGIMSPDGKTKAFAAAANGTGAGEATACLLLKPLEQALKDGDIVHAVIKATAVNQDAARSSNLTAPSSIAQAEVITRAWDRAGIDPETIGYMETHGTGTPIGDPIEIDGLTRAFRKYTRRNQFCAISSLKSNIGHTDSAAGISAVIKAVLSLKHQTLLPSLHFNAPNPLIDFINAPVYVNTVTAPWHTVEGAPRRAGVSAFGISGTNCHVVLEEAPPLKNINTYPQKPYFIGVSAATTASLQDNIDCIRSFLEENSGYALPDLSYTLNAGRHHHKYRRGIVADTVSGLIDQLKTATAEEIKRKNTWFVFSGDMHANPDWMPVLCEQYAPFKTAYDACLQYLHHKHLTEAEIRFIWQYCLFRLLESMGLATKKVMGTGQGKLVIQVLKGNLQLQEAIAQLSGYDTTATAPLLQRLHAFIQQAGDDCAIVEIGVMSEISAAIQSLRLPVTTLLNADGSDNIALLLKDAYLADQPVNWSAYYSADCRRLELPGYQFAATRCWLLEKGEVPYWLYEETTPAPEQIVAVKKNDRPAFSATENLVADCWEEVLMTADISPDDNFFVLGGHSLLGIRILNAINKCRGISLKFRSILEYPTIRELSAFIDTLETTAVTDANTIPVLEEKEMYPLSPAQERLWILNKVEDVRGAYNVPGVYRLKGKLSVPALMAAWDALLLRQASLRTTFTETEGKPYQVIGAPPAASSLQFTDMRNSSGSLVNEAVRKITSTDLDPETGPLVKAALFQVAEDTFVFVFVLHHIIADGWSLAILLRELLQLYEGGNAALPLLPVQYKDYASWKQEQLQESGFQQSRDYWLQQLQGELPVLDFPADNPRPAVKTFSGAVSSFTLDAATTHQLERLCRETGATMFMVFVAGIKALAFRYTGHTDLIIGTTVAGREQQSLEGLIGFFVNTLVLRSTIHEKDSFLQWLQKVKENILQAFEHQEYPFDKLVGEVQPPRNTARSPFFDIRAEFNEMDMQVAVPPGMQDIQMDPYHTGAVSSKYDITFRCYKGEQLRIDAEYNTDLFSEERMRDILLHLGTLLSAAAANSDTPVQQLRYLPLPVEQALLAQHTPLLPAAPQRSIVELFEYQAQHHGDAIAVVAEGVQLTYGALNAAANRLAHYLRHEYQVQRDEVVGVMLGRSERLIIGMLGILKSGAAYLPVDIMQPAARKQLLLADAGVKVLLTDLEFMFEAGSYTGHLVALDVQLPVLETAEDNPAMMNSAGDLAYVIYTSGSTGQPKGVCVTHASLLNYVHWFRDEHQLTMADHTLLLSSVAFDLCYTSLWTSLCSGCSLHLLPERAIFDATELHHYLQKENITYIKLTPSHFRMLLQQPEFEQEVQLYSLRLIVLGGESLRGADVAAYLQYRPDTRMLNHYGPTETTIGVLTHAISTDNLQQFLQQPVLGRPIRNVHVYVLDDAGNLCGTGVTGELYFSGYALARGYLGNEEQTAARFIPHPYEPGQRLYRSGDMGMQLADGTIRFLGRRDKQLKVRGYRVDTGEIEAALQQHPFIRGAAVIAQERAGDTELIAYYESTSVIAADELKTHLQLFLPAYMLPVWYVQLEQLPLTGNGKLDHKSLPAPDMNGQANSHYEAAGNELEARLVALWEEVLEREHIGIQDNFFDIGGNSLKLITIFNTISKIYPGLKISKLFSYPTISTQAAFISERISNELNTENALKEIEF